MSGVSIVIDVADLATANALIARFADLNEAALLTVVGGIGEMQTRRRIEEEKTSPDGAAWPANWAGTSTLLQTGDHLRDSIAFEVGSSEVSWGATWEYAHVHQEGATITPRYGKVLKFWFLKGGFNGNASQSGVEYVIAKSVTIPARPFVGLSGANGIEIEHVVTDWLGRLAR